MRLAIRVSAALFLATVVMMAPAARAQTNRDPNGDHPQAQAVQHPRLIACSFKSVGSACTFSRNGHTLSGTCQPIGQGQLACINAIGRPGLLEHPPDAGMSAGDLPNQ